jgi:hypothetical protein
MNQSPEAPVAKPCRELPPFRADDLDSIRAAFKHSSPYSLKQAWRPENEPDFAPAQASAGWCEDSLFVFAELTDADIFSRAEKNNEKLWELGDAFEIFLMPEGQKSYFEFHIAPNNVWLQLRFPEIGAVSRIRATGSCEEFLVHEPLFNFKVWTQPESKRWFVLAQIPAKSVCEKIAPLPGLRWKFSFSRYDYTHGREKPVISSTSAHSVPNFHHVHEWNVLEFVK